MPKESYVEPHYTIWANDERSYREENSEPLDVTGARHVLYELAATNSRPGYISRDPEKLARYLKISVQEWLRLSPSITKDWTVDGENFVISRVRKRMEEALEFKKKKSNSGKLGAKARKKIKRQNALSDVSDATSDASTSLSLSPSLSLLQNKIGKLGV